MTFAAALDMLVAHRHPQTLGHQLYEMWRDQFPDQPTPCLEWCDMPESQQAHWEEVAAAAEAIHRERSVAKRGQPQ